MQTDSSDRPGSGLRGLSGQRAFQVVARDTAGAGDVYHGAYIYGLLRGWDTARCMEFASAAAAVKRRNGGGWQGVTDPFMVREASDRVFAHDHHGPQVSLLCLPDHAYGVQARVRRELYRPFVFPSPPAGDIIALSCRWQWRLLNKTG
ncbi:MAG: hypothetical protein B5M55_06400 [Desulfococcus sp. 4484_242]|nr:MAG: hypothetical protein B5M55_06400 [Desulfococcus sp. 4484_242]